MALSGRVNPSALFWPQVPDRPALQPHSRLPCANPVGCSAAQRWSGFRIVVPANVSRWPDMVVMSSDVAPLSFPSEPST